MKGRIDNKGLKELVALAQRNGARMELSGRHTKLRLASGKILVLARSASCWRAELNNRAILRRMLREDGILQ